MIHAFDFIFVYKVLLDQLKWEKCYFMGHSLGGQIAVMFAQFFSTYFEKIILLDSIFAYNVIVPWYRGYYGDRIKAVAKYHEIGSKGQAPSYTYEQAIERVMGNRQCSRECAEIYLKRTLVRRPDGKYQFSMDPRVKHYLQPPGSPQRIIKLFERYPIQCPVLMIICKQNEMQMTYFKDVIEYCKTLENFTIHYVDYGHDAHFTNPEVVAPFVCDFLQKVDVKSKL